MIALGVLVGVSFLVYWPVVSSLVSDWVTDDNYSHGFLIVPLAAWFAWERRQGLIAASPRPTWAGLFVVLVSLGLLVAGTLGAERFLARVSMIGLLAGAVLFLCGWAWLHVLAFPLAFLLLMIPIPGLVFNQVAFPLQLLASQAGEATLSALSIPVLREGNVIHLANTSLEVAEACSGIRSLVSLLTLGIVYGYFMDPRGWVRVTIAAAAVPVAIVANGLRVAGTGVAAHYYGPSAANGFLHTFSGWAVFLVAVCMLFVVERGIGMVARR
jgi:exosortase